MKAKNFSLILAFFLALGFLQFASAASYHGSLKVDTGSGSVVIEPEACEEDWSGSFWSECVDKNQTFMCFDKNFCGTQTVKPANCGQVRGCDSEPPTPPPSNGGGGGGGGGSGGGSSGSGRGGTIKTSARVDRNTATSSYGTSCIENWKCGDWSNIRNECGKRTCNDINDCGTSELKPVVEKQCSSFGIFGITGNVIDGIQDFTKSRTNAVILLAVIFAGIVIAIVLLRKVSKGKSAKPEENPTEAKNNSKSNSK
jgi:hypothetical protein